MDVLPNCKIGTPSPCKEHGRIIVDIHAFRLRLLFSPFSFFPTCSLYMCGFLFCLSLCVCACAMCRWYFVALSPLYIPFNLRRKMHWRCTSQCVCIGLSAVCILYCNLNPYGIRCVQPIGIHPLTRCQFHSFSHYFSRLLVCFARCQCMHPYIAYTLFYIKFSMALDLFGTSRIVAKATHICAVALYF